MKLLYEAYQRIFENKLFLILKNMSETIIIICFFAIQKAPFFLPDLEVVSGLINIGSSIYKTKDSSSSAVIGNDFEGLKQLVGLTSDLLIIRFNNNTSRRIDDIELEVYGFGEIFAVSMQSDSSRMLKDINVITNVKLDKNLNAFLPGFKSIPPNSYVELQIWGHIKLYSLFKEKIKIKSSAETTSLTSFGAVGGLRLFIAENLGAITILIAAYFFIIGFRRMKKANLR